jgi:hypothetical protein
MLTHIETRRWLYRFRREAQGAVTTPGAPAGLRDVYAAQPYFSAAGGWSGFSELWDISEDDFAVIVPLERSLSDEWEAHCAAAAKEFPKHELVVERLPDREVIESAEVTVLLLRD